MDDYEEEQNCYEEGDSKIDNNSFYSPVSSDSETDGDDLDGDEDIDIRKNIKPILNLGQTIPALWSISLIEHAEKVEQDFSSYVNESETLSRSAGSGTLNHERFFETKHRRAPSLPTQLKLNEIKLKLDNIELNKNDEYGFNHIRSRPGRQKCGRNSVSLYSSNERISDIISLSNPEQLSEFFLSANNLLQSKSLAKNAKEIKLEEEILQLRSQPSTVEFSRKNEAKDHLKDIMTKRNQRKFRRRSRSLKRRLSFDSHPRRRAFSDTDNVVKKSNRNSVKDLKNKDSLFVKDKEKSPKKLANNVSHHQSDPEISNSENIKLAPPPVLEDKTILEVLVSNTPDNQVKEKRRKSSIPQFLNALRLPNKKAIKKKFMRRKNERRRSPVIPNIPAPFPAENEPQATSTEGDAEKENLPSSSSVNTFDRSSDTDGPGDKKSQGRRFFGSSGSVRKISCSTCSLPKVEEDKESSKFDATLTRKSCSTCSIVAAKIFGGAKEEDAPVLERRMSDTALTWKKERQPSCSPGRRFILRLLSPVVCGLSHEKYSNFQSCESYSSLNSYGSDLSIEADFLSQKFSDFNPQEIAEELALIDKELLIRITWQELSNCGWMSINKFVTSPNVMNMVEFFNRVAMMVASSILAEDSVYMRAKVISKMIKLAEKCRILKNYNSLRAVLGGLQCTPIFRLEATWKQVRARRKRLFSDLSNLMGETDNFACYRDELARSLKEPPCLPFLGDFLTQIAQTQAYLAVQRKRSFTKRLQKASVTSNNVSSLTPSGKCENSSGVCSETSKDALSLTRTSDATNGDDSSKRELPLLNTDEKQNSNAINLETPYNTENRQIVTEKTGSVTEDKKSEKNLEICLNHSNESTNKNCNGLIVDETDKGRSRSKSKNENKNDDDNDDGVKSKFSSSIFYVDIENVKESKDLIDLHKLVVKSSENASVGSELTDGNTEVNKVLSVLPHDAEILGTDDKFSENTTDCMISSEVHDNSVFVDDELYETTSTPITLIEKDSRAFSFNQKPVLQIDACCCPDDTSSGHTTAETRDNQRGKPDVCECRDLGIGSASSCGNSPQRIVFESSSKPENLAIMDTDAEKRTHARCDSNDSGVVLHNGRSSRASDELSASRDNLDMIQTSENSAVAGNDNSTYEDTKLGRDFDVIIEDVLDSADSGHSNNTKTDGFSCRQGEVLNVDDAEETKKLEEMIRKRKPTEREAKIQKEYQFWQYQIAAIQYNHASKPPVRKFLLNACYNSEEENYSLSLKREPITKKISR